MTLRPSLRPPEPADGGPAFAADRAPRVAAAIAILPTALTLVAEAAWVTIVAGLLQAFTRHAPVLGFGWFVAATLAGVVATRAVEPRVGSRWPVVAAALALATGAVGWLLSPDVRSILARDGLAALGPAIAANIGGWLGSVAFVRGVAHARLPADPRRIGTMLGIAVPGLAAIAIVGGMVGEPVRSAFLGEAQAEVVVFLLAGISALALARLGLVATGAAVDWRRNPAWLALLLVLLAITALVSVATSLVAGPAIVMLLSAVITPLIIVGFFVGFDRRSFLILALSVVGTAAVATLLQLFASSNSAPPPASPNPSPGAEPEAAAGVPVAFGVLGVLLALAVLALLVLARLWLRRPRDDDPLVPETREIDRGELDADRSRRRRRALAARRRPRDAVAAYRTLLEELDRYDDLRRQPGETPAEHAARLRDDGRGSLGLDLLAADYGLVRFGGVTLSAPEIRRAVGRARWLARELPKR
jgi:hypothetical protein